MRNEIVTEAAKSTPPVAVTLTAFLGGINLNAVISIVTVVYVVLQAGYLVWRWRRDIKAERRKARERRTKP